MLTCELSIRHIKLQIGKVNGIEPLCDRKLCTGNERMYGFFLFCYKI